MPVLTWLDAGTCWDFYRKLKRCGRAGRKMVVLIDNARAATWSRFAESGRNSLSGVTIRLPQLVRGEMKAREWFFHCARLIAQNAGWMRRMRGMPS